MKNLFIINAAQRFQHAQGSFNRAVTDVTIQYFKGFHDVNILVTDIEAGYDVLEEVEKYKWVELIIYHTPIWWFNIAHQLKKYFDEALSASRLRGLASGDGRSRADPAKNYGTGGLLKNKSYMVTTSMNAPAEAFIRPNDFLEDKT